VTKLTVIFYLFSYFLSIIIGQDRRSSTKKQNITSARSANLH